MPSYRNCQCAICYMELKRPQNTCGSRECRDVWKNLGRDARLKHLNLASMSPSERAYCLTQGPSPEELEAQAASREQLNNDVEEYQQQQQKKQDSGFMPKSLRDMLIANAPIKKDETDGDTEPIDAPNPDPTDS